MIENDILDWRKETALYFCIYYSVLLFGLRRMRTVKGFLDCGLILFNFNENE